jgi:hypothetical protein
MQLFNLMETVDSIGHLLLLLVLIAQYEYRTNKESIICDDGKINVVMLSQLDVIRMVEIILLDGKIMIILN